MKKSSTPLGLTFHLKGYVTLSEVEGFYLILMIQLKMKRQYVLHTHCLALLCAGFKLGH